MARLIIVSLAAAAVAFAVGFHYGVGYGVEGVKKWWLSKGKNTNNPHYRIIK